MARHLMKSTIDFSERTRCFALNRGHAGQSDHVVLRRRRRFVASWALDLCCMSGSWQVGDIYRSSNSELLHNSQLLCEAGSMLFVCARFRILAFPGVQATPKTVSPKSITAARPNISHKEGLFLTESALLVSLDQRTTYGDEEIQKVSNDVVFVG